MRFPRLVTVIALVGFVSLGCASLSIDEGNVTSSEPDASREHDQHDEPNSTLLLQDRERLAAFGSSRYTYCDAKMIALVWGSSVGDAKLTLGQKVLSRLTDLADDDIAEGRAQALAAFDSNSAIRCTYQEAGYTSDDAVLLGAMWGMESWDAKLHIERKILWGNEPLVQEALEQARSGSHVPDSTVQDSHFERFLNSKYTYCDAKMIALVWGTSVFDAKGILGQKIDSGLTDLADADITSGRAQALEAFDSNPAIRCSYEEAGFSYSDAVRLGELWGIDSWDAKLYIERKVLLDDLSSVTQALKAKKG